MDIQSTTTQSWLSLLLTAMIESKQRRAELYLRCLVGEI